LLNKTFVSDCRQFLDIYVSRGSVATHLRCGRNFNHKFITRLLLGSLVKEFRKLSSILTTLLASLECPICFACGKLSDCVTSV